MPTISNGFLTDSTGMDGETTKATNAPPAETKVFESNVRLLPSSNCMRNHGKGKGRLRPGQDPDDPDIGDCGFYLECDEGTIFPASARQKHFRLTTADPIHDLKRWLTTPNQCISGEECIYRAEDAEFFILSSRYTEEHFRECILWAVEEIKYIHTTVRVKIDYLGAPPYDWSFYQNPINEATSPDALPTSQTMQGARRSDLTSWMVEMAVELDYLKTQEVSVRNEILQLKWARAKRGHWGEISDLLESGWVTEEDVQRVCCV